ncbi:MAG: hypothetical protein ACFE9Z_00125 [Promethearchaeota archaeon]
MAITVEGNLQQEIMRSALKKVQEKHPLLQAQLYVDENEKPYFVGIILVRFHWNLYSELMIRMKSKIMYLMPGIR